MNELRNLGPKNSGFAEIGNLAADEIERLRAAIRKHRSDVWGDGQVEHPEDIALYAALDQR